MDLCQQRSGVPQQTRGEDRVDSARQPPLHHRLGRSHRGDEAACGVPDHVPGGDTERGEHTRASRQLRGTGRVMPVQDRQNELTLRGVKSEAGVDRTADDRHGTNLAQPVTGRQAGQVQLIQDGVRGQYPTPAPRCRCEVAILHNSRKARLSRQRGAREVLRPPAPTPRSPLD